MLNYQGARVKIKITQLSKLKSAAKNKRVTILRLTKKNFEDEELPHELFLTTSQTSNIRNAFTSNMPTDIRLTKNKISKTIQSGGYVGSWLGNLGKKALTNITIHLARGNLPAIPHINSDINPPPPLSMLFVSI